MCGFRNFTKAALARSVCQNCNSINNLLPIMSLNIWISAQYIVACTYEQPSNILITH